MAVYKIAHIRERGQDMIIVPLDSQFHYRTAQEKESFRLALGRCAANAGLKGTVCLVWTYGSRLYSISPPPWHPFFKTVSMAFIARNINKNLTCDFG